GCLREKLKIPSGQRHELCYGLHAEQNVILQAALYGTSTKDSILYITNQPCIICAKMLINAGIKEIVTSAGYPDRLAKQFLKAAGIKIKKAK
ncbi:MAG: cytidine deaminase, partial [Candidatus Omnitrophica bacterium]|nr:cytidine deaminase [Candidatus Omnitrophota bacterium]